MQLLNLKTSPKPIQQYYKSLQTLDKLWVANEMGCVFYAPPDVTTEY